LGKRKKREGDDAGEDMGDFFQNGDFEVVK